ncbi:MAG: AAA family ATPase [Myxococcota bacterium]
MCGFDNPAGAKFCSECGAGLTTSGRAAPAEMSGLHNLAELAAAADLDPEPAPDAAATERRHVSVLFYQVVGVEQLAETLDPEDLREVIVAIQRTAAEVVERYEGHIAQYLVDGLLVYFGYPKAHEDDARRAIRCALDSTQAIDRRNPSGDSDVPGALPRARIRVAIHSGDAVGGDLVAASTREQLVIGQTPNTAARLLELAGPGSVVVSADTRRLARGYFHYESLGAHLLKGLSQPLEVFRALAESGLHGRFELALSEGLSPLVGRDSELRELRARIVRASEGTSAPMLIVGEAGVGKSRLIHALRQHTRDLACAWWILRCSPFTQHSDLHPLRELLANLFELSIDSADGRSLSRLEGRLHGAGLSLDDYLPVVAALLSVPLPGAVGGRRAPTAGGEGDSWRPLRYRELRGSPQKQRVQVIATAVRMLLELAAGHGAVLVVEDLHWMDPSTLSFLDQLLACAPAMHLLPLLTARPEFQPPPSWSEQESESGSEGRPDTLVLRSFPGQATRDLAEAVACKTLPNEVLDFVVAKTDGVPLFVEELTKAIVESGILTNHDGNYELTGAIASLDIPTNLRSSLVARLDRLGEAKEVAQLASVIGRVFSVALLVHLTPLDTPALEHALGQLVAAGLIYRHSPRNTYTFKHALVHDAAYDCLLKKRRRTIHAEIVHTLEQNFPDVVFSEPELLAYHCERAEFHDLAIRYLQGAGERAAARSAHAEAIRHFTRAIDLLSERPPSRTRDMHEIQLRAALGGRLIARYGYAAEELADNFARAQELCAEVGDPPELLPVMYGLWVFNLARSNRATTIDYANTLLGLSGRADDGIHRLTSISAYAITQLYSGQLGAARIHFERVQSLYRPEQHGQLVRTFGDDSGVYAEVYLAWLHLLAGRPARALDRDRAARALSAQLADPLAASLIESFSMLIRHDLGDVDGTRAVADSVIALASEQGFPFWLALGQFGRGWARVKSGEVDSGIAEILEGLGFLRAIDQKLPATYWMSYLVEAYLDAGRVGEGLELVDKALAMASSNVDSFYSPELHRLKGELLRLDSDGDSGSSRADQAAENFEQAIATARAFDATLLELRAAVSAGQLWCERGQGQRARQLIAPLHDALRANDGAEIHDARRAAALLDQL